MIRRRLAELLAAVPDGSPVRRLERWFSAQPDAVVRLVNPAKFREMAAPPSEPFAIADTSRRLLIAPLNTAGQGYQWARAAERLADTSAVSWAMVHDDGAAFRVDRAVPRSVALGGRDWLRDEFRAVSSRVTHVMLESVHPVFGPYLQRDVEREVRALQRRGIRVAIVAHGSDVRGFAAHAARSAVSPYRLPAAQSTLPTLEAASARNRALIERLDLPVFGSTPGVLLDVPQATWLPVAIDPNDWRVDTPVLERPRPVVVHAPSSAMVKGSEVADAVLGQLHSEGRIVYERLERVEHASVREAYRAADVVVDSLRMGGYGVAACEAMAAGRLVVTHINASTRAAVRDRLGVEPPVIEADADSLDAVMRALLDDRAGAQRVALQGPDFVDTLHDGRASAAALEGFLAS